MFRHVECRLLKKHHDNQTIKHQSLQTSQKLIAHPILSIHTLTRTYRHIQYTHDHYQHPDLTPLSPFPPSKILFCSVCMRANVRIGRNQWAADRSPPRLCWGVKPDAHPPAPHSWGLPPFVLPSYTSVWFASSHGVRKHFTRSQNVFLH